MGKIKQDNLETLLCVSRDQWGFNTSINIHCNTKARFSKCEFCLVIGLKFGPMSTIISGPYEVILRGIHERY
ncbi:Uncharacterized protein TCM_039749 [Theobroma cacao]|uniref:Uncharacterized protein n=1 Tax=Theobroma cacao TaxID=3641 RepID=A0A061GS26_THECC|nr:Uncharacterized protein TCM_039749 [Theobroma cacao]